MSVWLFRDQRSGEMAIKSDHRFTCSSSSRTYTNTHSSAPTWVTSWQSDSKYVLKYASKPSILVHPNRHVQEDKAIQRQLISHWLCWGPVWARLWSTDRETDGTILAGGVFTVLSACVHASVYMYVFDWLFMCVHTRMCAFSCVFMHFQTSLCSPHTSRMEASGYASSAFPNCFLLPS